jgi:enamine deaminase RidA (YjgF/YER057c/UK114 family)
MARRENVIYGRRATTPPGMADFAEEGHFSPAVEVDGTLYVAGQIGLADGWPIEDPVDQTVAAFEALKEVLEASGYTFGEVADLITFHTDLGDLEMFSEVKDRYITGPLLPPWTAIGVAALFKGVRVEIKCTASRAR